MKKKFMKFISIICALVMTVLLIPTNAQAASGLKTTADVAAIQKYGNVVLSLSKEELFKAGYQYGDVLNVSFLGQTLELPLCSNYSDVDSGTPAVFARDADTFVLVAINMGDFATKNNIATKTTNPDKSFVWTPCAGVTSPVNFTISLKEAGGYYDQYLLHKLSYNNNRANYSNLTDEQFANFRQVTTTGIAPGILYRSSSPINPENGRNTYADAALKKAGVTVIMNLADDDATVKSYPGIYATYYSQQKYIPLNMGVDFSDSDFKDKLAQGLRYFANNKGTYLVHCTEGKDRAGFVTAILECLMGASYNEVVSDYMETFYNYYAITPDQDRYAIIANSNIVKTLQNAFGVKDLKSANLSSAAEKYVRSIGLTDDEIAQLKANLSGAKTQVQAAAADTTAVDTTATAAPVAERIYVVKENDTLRKIAASELGDSNAWEVIYNNNKDVIKNPNLIFAGQELKIAN